MATLQNTAVTGSLTVSGQLIAQTLNVQQVTSSIVYSSGSNIFGKLVSDVQQFTGSLRVSGSGVHWIVGGSVGIGTTSTDYKLEVNGDLQDFVLSNNTDSTYKSYFGTKTDGSLQIYAYKSGTGAGYKNILLNVDGVTSGGSVGIGTASPSAKLDVAGNVVIENGYNLVIGDTIASPVASTSKAALTLRKFSSGTASSIISASYYIGVGGNEYGINTYRLIGFGYAETSAQTTYPAYIGYKEISTAGYTYGDLIFGTRTSIGASDDPTVRMTIRNDGNVGIGITTPTDKLEIYNGTYHKIKTFFEGSYTSGFKFSDYNGGIKYDAANDRLTLFANYTGGVNASEITFETSGSEKMRVDANGNIGINTTSPNGSLDIYGTTGAKVRIGYFTDQGTDDPTLRMFDGKLTRPAYSFTSDNTSGMFGGSGFVAFSTNASERMRIISSGNVGIGTTAPSSILHIKGPGTSGDDFGAEARVVENTYGAFLQGSTIGNTGAFVGNFRYNFSNATGSTQTYPNAGYGMLFKDGVHIYSSNPGGSGGDTFTPSERFTINSAGNVGIGTTNPTQKLHVSGGYIITRDPGGETAFMQGGSGYAYFGNLNSGPAAFGNGENYTTLVADGSNIGIGSTSPSARLDVVIQFNSVNKALYVRNSDRGINTTSYDTVVIQQDDVATLRLVEKNTTTDQVMTLSIGDGYGRIATSAQPLQFYVNGASGSTGYTGLGGTLAMNIDINGKVGINTSSNEAQFYIYNNYTYSAANLNEATSSAMAFRIRSRAGSNVNMVMGAFDSTQAGLQALNSSDASAVGFLLNPYGGSIGIGTTAPSSLLHTYTSGDNVIRVQTTGNSTAANYFMTNVSGSARRYYSGVNISNALGGFEIYDDTAGASRLYISSSGNVGLGTTTPSQKLHVNGGYFLVNNNGSGDANSGLRMFSSVATTHYNWMIGAQFNTSGFEITPSTAVGGTTFSSPAFVIRNDSNIGIGTTSPESLLQLGGYTGNPVLTFAATSNGTSRINFYDSNNTEGLYLSTTGESHGGTMYFGARWDDDEAKIVFRMYQVSAGGSYHARVGIGTTSPAASLHVAAENNNNDGTIKLGARLWLQHNDASTTTSSLANDYNSDAARMEFRMKGNTSADTKMAILGSGCIGVGTIAPSARLHISGDGSASNQLRINHNGSGTNGFLDINVTDTRATISTNYSSTNIPLEIKSYGNTNQLFLATSGSVGIGTSNPSYPLDVIWSGGGYGLRVKATGNYNGIISDTSTNTGGGYFAAFKNGTRYSIFGTTGAWLGDTSTDTAIVSEAANSTIRFYTNGSSSERMRIDANGNVGIATTSPSALLHVEGLGLSAATDSVYITNRRGGQFPLRILVTQGDYQGVLIEHQDGLGSGGPGPLGTYGFKFDDKRVSGTYTAHPSASFVIARSNTYNNTNIFEVRPYNTTAAIAVATGGNVGVGTASPNSPLHVWKDAGDGNSIVRLRNSNSTFRTTLLQFEDYAGAYADGFVSFNVKSGAAAGSYLGLGVSTTGSLVIAYGGNVGVGSVSPQRKFVVNGDANIGGSIVMGGISDAGSLATGYIYMLEGQGIAWYNSAFNAGRASIQGTSAGHIILDPTGNVGIDTTAPTEKLQVEGYILNRSKLGFVQRHDIVKNGLSFYVDFNNKNCWDPVVDGTPSGTSVKDLSNNKYTVAFANGSSIAAKDGNYGLYGNGTGHYMSVQNYVLSSLPHTWEAWVLADGFSGYDTFWDSGTERPLFGALNANPLFYPDAAVTSVTLSTGKWYHFVVAMASNNTYQFYMNGRQISSTTYGSTIRTGTFDMWLGGDGGSESWNGYIPIARMYNRQLSATEVMQNYNAEKWRFDNNSTFYHDVATGNVGIGTTNPAYALDVTGTIRATGDVIAYSDARVKENIKTIEAPLDLITKLRGVTYTRKDIEDKSEKVGVIAQEVLEVLPQVVSQDTEGKYNVAYGNIVGVLIEAIKELKAEIDTLKNK